MPYGYYHYDWRGEPDLDPQYYDCWVCNVAHSVPAWTPLFTSEWYRLIPYAMQYANDYICEPTSKGWDWRIYNGYAYITSIKVPESEVEGRKQVYREQLASIIDDPWGYSERLFSRLMEKYDYYKPLNVKEMRDCELVQHLWDMAELDRLMWEVHMLGWDGLLGGLRLWREMLVDLFGITPYDVRYAKLLSGFDNALFKLNSDLTHVAARAVELNVESNFSLPDEEVIPAMEQTEAGREWLGEFDKFLNEHGYRSDRMLEFTRPTWLEKPTLAIPDIRRIISAGVSHAPDILRHQLRKEGEEIERELLAKLPSDQREWFHKLTQCAQAAHSWSESHDYWCEFQTYGLRRRAIKELSERLYRKDIIDDPEDTAYLLHQDLIYAAVIQEKVGKKYFRDLIKRNKEEFEYYKSIPPGGDTTPLFLGDPSKLPLVAGRDTLFGVVAAPPAEDAAKVGAVAVGCAGAPGIVEGTARVIASASEWDQIKPGDILVCPMTDATWTPLFALLKGVVTDSGGLLAHPAIVCREYGIPAVCGTFDASKKIKTGDRIRVDGNLLRVYKLDQ
ncbi:MAG: hypothetical protein D9V47_05115 [Clostridia bacterium]|nr:MAG: hypothetical protein D9V47_05115 [Clostridia bacterium]